MKSRKNIIVNDKKLDSVKDKFTPPSAKKRTTSTGYMPRAEMIKKNKKLGADTSASLISKKGLAIEKKKNDAWDMHGEYVD